jgi:uncharacterized membrane protein
MNERDPYLSQLLGAVIRASLRASGLVLTAGLVLFLIMPGSFADRLLLGGILLVVITPLFNVLQVLFDEIARREWLFVGVTLVVAALLAWALLG